MNKTSNNVVDYLRPIEIVMGYRNIADVLRCGVDKVKTFVHQGAPIYLDKKGAPRAEKTEIWEWYKKNVNRV